MQPNNNVLPLSYLRLDIDDFSGINTRFGHEFGDEVLRAVAGTLRAAVRPTDYAIRYGGEEFDVILPYTASAGAQIVAEKLVRGIRLLSFSPAGQSLTVSASIGVTSLVVSLREYYDTAGDPERLKSFWSSLLVLQSQADHACYDAKASGKNCFRTYSDSKDYAAIRGSYASRHERD